MFVASHLEEEARNIGSSFTHELVASYSLFFLFKMVTVSTHIRGIHSQISLSELSPLLGHAHS